MDKLSYRDRMILIVVSIVVILAIGFLLFVKPKYESIQTDKTTLADRQEVWDDKESKFAQIPVVEKRIEEKYAQAKALSDGFCETLSAYKVDQFIQKYINENQITVNGALQITEPTVQPLEYYKCSSSVLDYPMLSAANLNGSDENKSDAATPPPTQAGEQSADTSVMTAENSPVSQITFEFRAKKENIQKFMDSIENIDGTVWINNIVINDYTFGKNSANKNDAGYTTGTMVINYYSIQHMPELNAEKTELKEAETTTEK